MNTIFPEGKVQIARVAGAVARCGRGELSRWKMRAGIAVAGSADARAQQQAGIGFPDARDLPQPRDRDIKGFQCWCLDFGCEVPPHVCGIETADFRHHDHLGNDVFFFVGADIDQVSARHIVLAFLCTKSRSLAGDHPRAFHLLYAGIDGDPGHDKFIRDLIYRDVGIALKQRNYAGIKSVNLHNQAAICGGLRLHTAKLQRCGLHSINLRTVSIVSAWLAGLSHLIRLTLGNRKAMPDL